MRTGFGVLRIERRDKAAMLPKLAFDRQFQLSGLTNRIFITVRNDVVRFRKPALVSEAVESILTHTHAAHILSRLSPLSLRYRFPNSKTVRAPAPNVRFPPIADISPACVETVADSSFMFHKMRMRPNLISAAIACVVVCGTQALAQANKDFSAPTAPELISGFELRDRYGLPKHIGDTAIYVDSVSVHHLRTEATTIVWKDGKGLWHRSQAVEIGPGGLLSVPRKLDSNQTRELTAAESQAVEQLIKEPSLYNGEAHRTGQLGLGAPSHVMAIITPYGRTTVQWDGRLVGTNGQMADLVLGHN